MYGVRLSKIGSEITAGPAKTLTVHQRLEARAKRGKEALDIFDKVHAKKRRKADGVDDARFPYTNVCIPRMPKL